VTSTSLALRWKYSTSVWAQELWQDGTDYVLHRVIASNPVSASRSAVADEVCHRLNSGRTSSIRIVRGHLDDQGTWSYSLQGDSPLAVHLWPSASTSWRGKGSAIAEQLGAVLAHIHGVPANKPLVNSPHLARLIDHLAEPGGSSVLAHLSSDTRTALISWAQPRSPSDVLCHGGFSLGSIYASSDLASVEVLLGDELTQAPPELDLGWLIGELTEFEHATLEQGLPPGRFSKVAQQVLQAYEEASGRSVSEHLLHRFIALRFALHLADYAQSFGSDGVSATQLRFLDWLIGRAA
jgi:hypothetical protein